MQETFADAFDKFATDGYWENVRKDAQMKRNHLLKQLAECPLDIKICAP